MHRTPRTLIRDRASALVHGDTLRLSLYDAPSGDPGLFGPDSVVWRVHADLPGMLMGGIAALMLQTLHPLAMAGVDQFSDYRSDPIARLNRTARFVSVTSYGSTHEAEAAIARVRRVHEGIRGTAPDGRPYAAGDPRLLTWIHVAEAACFLRGYEVFGPRGDALTSADRDSYFREAATVAQRLGAADVPRSAAEVRAYFDAIRPELAVTDAALEAVRFFRSIDPSPGVRPAVRILMGGAISLLPPWASDALNLRRTRLSTALVYRPAAHALGAVLRYATHPSPIVTTATARTRIPTQRGLGADDRHTPPGRLKTRSPRSRSRFHSRPTA
ncbi:MAG TPA: oxygenase MpaB family protein [Actinocrinis sp.]